jgi:hypothetical protein
MPSTRKRRERRILRKLLGRTDLPFTYADLIHNPNADRVAGVIAGTDTVYPPYGETPATIEAVRASIRNGHFLNPARGASKLQKDTDFVQGNGMANENDKDGAGIMASEAASSEADWTGVPSAQVPHFYWNTSFPFNGQAAPTQSTTAEALDIGKTNNSAIFYSPNGPNTSFIARYSAAAGLYPLELGTPAGTPQVNRFARVFIHGDLYDQTAGGAAIKDDPADASCLGNRLHVSGAGDVNATPLLLAPQCWTSGNVHRAGVTTPDGNTNAVFTITGSTGTTYVISSSNVNNTTAAGTVADPFTWEIGAGAGDTSDWFINLKTVVQTVASDDFIVRAHREPRVSKGALWLYSKNLGAGGACSITSSDPTTAPVISAAGVEVTESLFIALLAATSTLLGTADQGPADAVESAGIGWITSSMPYTGAIALDWIWESVNSNPASFPTSSIPGYAVYMTSSNTTGNVPNIYLP